MMLRFATALAACSLMIGPALAGHCPQDAAAVEHALPLTELSDQERSEIENLKNQGMEQHEAGNHAESEALLAEAMRRLLLAQQ